MKLKVFVLSFLLIVGIAGAIGTFTYTESTNVLEVTLGTSGTPATFADMFAADQSGTGTELLAAVSGAANNTLTFQIRPTDDCALIIKCIVAAKTAEADYIFITGTDAWGAAQTESLDVTAGNATYTTTKRFATITNLDCSDNANGGGTVWADGTIAVTQDIWGVVWEIVQDAVYTIAADIDFGDGSTPTYFASEWEQVYFVTAFTIKSSAIVRIGDLDDSWAVKGSMWHLGTNSDTYLIASGSTGQLKLYGSYLLANTDQRFRFDGPVDINHSQLATKTLAGLYFSFRDPATTIKNLYVNTVGQLKFTATPASMDNVHIHNSSNGIYAVGNASVTNLKITKFEVTDVITNSSEFILIDPQFSIANPGLAIAGDSLIVKYTTNIHVTDNSGADLAGVDIDVTYAHLIEGDDGKDYICIVDHTSVTNASDGQPPTNDGDGNWVLYSDDVGADLGGDWNAGFDYKDDEPEFATGITDAGGNLLTATELITNGNNDADSGWADFGTPSINEISNDQAVSPISSRKFTSDTSFEGIQSSPNPHTTKTGTQYRFSAWVYPVDTTDIRIYFKEGDGVGESYNVNHTGLTEDSWNLITGVFEESSGGDGAYIMFSNNSAVPATFYIDDTTIREVGEVIQYKKWVGTSELMEARAHMFTFTLAGYKPLIMENVIVDHPMVWEIEMPEAVGPFSGAWK